MEVTRIPVVDDHRSFADLLSLAPEREDDPEIISQATSGARARELIAQGRPDILLMDVGLRAGAAGACGFMSKTVSLGRASDPRTIAHDLGISLHTCRGHAKSVLSKMMHAVLEAVVTATRARLIRVGP